MLERQVLVMNTTKGKRGKGKPKKKRNPDYGAMARAIAGKLQKKGGGARKGPKKKRNPDIGEVFADSAMVTLGALIAPFIGNYISPGFGWGDVAVRYGVGAAFAAFMPNILPAGTAKQLAVGALTEANMRAVSLVKAGILPIPMTAPVAAAEGVGAISIQRPAQRPALPSGVGAVSFAPASRHNARYGRR